MSRCWKLQTNLVRSYRAILPSKLNTTAPHFYKRKLSSWVVTRLEIRGVEVIQGQETLFWNKTPHWASKMCETFDFPSCCTPQSVKSCKSKHHMLAVMESRLNFDRLYPERRHTKRRPWITVLLHLQGWWATQKWFSQTWLIQLSLDLIFDLNLSLTWWNKLLITASFV